MHFTKNKLTDFKHFLMIHCIVFIFYIWNNINCLTEYCTHIPHFTSYPICYHWQIHLQHLELQCNILIYRIGMLHSSITLIWPASTWWARHLHLHKDMFNVYLYFLEHCKCCCDLYLEVTSHFTIEPNKTTNNYFGQI